MKPAEIKLIRKDSPTGEVYYEIWFNGAVLVQKISYTQGQYTVGVMVKTLGSMGFITTTTEAYPAGGLFIRLNPMEVVGETQNSTAS